MGCTLGDEDWLVNVSDTDSGCCKNVSYIPSLALVLGGVNSWKHIECMPYLITRQLCFLSLGILLPSQVTCLGPLISLAEEFIAFTTTPTLTIIWGSATAKRAYHCLVGGWLELCFSISDRISLISIPSRPAISYVPSHMCHLICAIPAVCLIHMHRFCSLALCHYQ